jgi:DNA-binding transcriptional ArsR family regulator
LREIFPSSSAKPFEMARPAISQHLKVLEDARLVACAWMARGALVVSQRLALKQWTCGSQCCKALKKNYDRLDEVLAGMEQPKIKRGEKR